MKSTHSIRPGETTSSVRLLRVLLTISIVSTIAALAASVVGGFGWQYFIPIGSILVIGAVCFVFLSRGITLPTRILLPSSLFIVVTYIIALPPGYGLHDINLIAYALVISLAGLTLGQRGTFIFAFLIIFSVFAIGIAEMIGQIVSPTSSLTLIISPFAISIVVLAITFVQRALINLLGENTQRARASEQEAIERSEELQKLSDGQEELIRLRTSDLDRVSRINEHRAQMFQAIAQVTRVIISTQNLQDLLPQITQMISQQFGFYHVGIFLLDTNNEYAVLSATNSEGGQRMLDRGHRLRVGYTGIVGNVAGSGKPRIALDTGADAAFFNNPDLPETRSEMALPLFRGTQQIIGVLDVQSTKANAFTQDDIQILSTLADQVSIAISNARLYEETQKALLEADMTYRRNIQTGWIRFTRSQKISGIRKQGVRSHLLFEPVDTPISADSPRENLYPKNGGHGNSSYTTIPMKLRGETVGVVNIKTEDGRGWGQDEMDIINAIMERAALSIDNARLLAESLKVAEKERVIGEIAAKVGSYTNRDIILQTAVAEIGRALTGAEVTIQLQKKDSDGR